MLSLVHLEKIGGGEPGKNGLVDPLLLAVGSRFGFGFALGLLVEDMRFRKAFSVTECSLLPVLEEVVVLVHLEHRSLPFDFGELGRVAHGSLVLGALVCGWEWSVVQFLVLDSASLGQLKLDLLIQVVHALENGIAHSG